MGTAAAADPTAWRAPSPGGWARDFRFGEWLGDPLTPLFETLLLPTLESSFWAALRRTTGMPTPHPTYVVVNGWYFTSLNFWPPHALGWIWQLIRHPRLLRVMLQFVPALAGAAVEPWAREWRSSALPRYRAIVRDAERDVEQLSPRQLVPLIERIGSAAGEYFCWIALVAGAGYKTEAPLARFYRRHLFPSVGGTHQALLTGLSDQTHAVGGHALYGLDWFQPTLGELHAQASAAEIPASDAASHSRARPTGVRELRERTVASARNALASRPRQRAEFDRLLATAQRFAILREEIIAPFTLAWPALRRAALLLGKALTSTGALSSADDVFFLTRDEIVTAVQNVTPVDATAHLSRQAASRKLAWERRRALTPPLRIGDPPALFKRGLDQLHADLSPSAPHDHARSSTVLRGQPVSPGIATGPACLIHHPQDFHRLQSGDVLVAPATTPAWTPLFARAAAVVTDSGGVLAHTSLVAREFGIPAVVATGNATASIVDGELLTVDGSSGFVHLHRRSAS
jgi:pyruvate,water dikinase